MGRSSASACLEMMRVYCDEARDDVEHEAAEGEAGTSASAAGAATAGATAEVCFFSVVIKEAAKFSSRAGRGESES